MLNPHFRWRGIQWKHFRTSKTNRVARSSEDLVFDGSHDWLEDKKSLTKVKKNKDVWSKDQKELVKKGVQTSDVHALKQAEKLTKLMCDLQKHGGPCATAEDVDKLSSTYSDDPKKLQRYLNEELRFRRDVNTRYAVNQKCPLYKQRGPDVDNKLRISNLKALLSRSDERSCVAMDDIRAAYNL